MSAAKDPINILLVDDRPEGLLALEAVLTNPEYNLIRANSGIEALKYVLDTEFAVILMDVQMPDLDGFETAAIIKQRDRSSEIPIIFITAINKDDHYVYRGYEVGAVDYLFKPFDPLILKSKVGVFVELFKNRRQIKRQAALLREVERRDREREVAALELEGLRRYRGLADAIPHMVWRAKTDLTFDYVNEGWVSFTGLSEEQSQNVGWHSAFHPDDLRSFLIRWRRAVLDEAGFDAECRVRKQALDEYRWCIVRVAPDRGSEGKIQAWIGTNTDIHDRRLADLERVRLLASEQKARADAEELARRFTQLASVVPQFVWEHDHNGRTWVNDRWSEYTGQKREEALGMGWLETVHPDDRPRVLERIEYAKAEKDIYEAEYRVRGRNGKYRWFLGKGAPIFGENGNVTRWVGVTTDIQAFHDLEEQRANFLSLASHELKTPLTSIKATLQLQDTALKRGLALSHEQLRRMLDTGIRSANRLSHLLDDLLDYSRVESGRLAIDPKASDLSEAVRETINSFNSTLEAEGRLKIVSKVPAVLEGVWDVGRLRQVTDNLVGNAIKYSPGAGTIKVVLARDGEDAIFSVTDQGIGIAPEDQQRIFKPFERAVDTKNYGGFGIGLYVSARIVEQHGGKIEVQSERGRGSTFTVRLPLKGVARPTEQAAVERTA